MNKPKSLTKISLIIVALALLLLLYNFFKMYTLVGNCPDGATGCAAYTQWQLLNKIGAAVLAAGIIIFAVSLLRRSKQ